jgi:hypothetical protein
MTITADGRQPRRVTPSSDPPSQEGVRAEGIRQLADDVCEDFAYAMAVKADPPTTVSELSKVLGVADRDGAQGRARRTKAKPATRRRARVEVGDGRLLQEDSGWVADARGKLKAGVEPDVFLALLQREVDGSKQYVASATKLRVRGCE